MKEKEQVTIKADLSEGKSEPVSIQTSKVVLGRLSRLLEEKGVETKHLAAGVVTFAAVAIGAGYYFRKKFNHKESRELEEDQTESEEVVNEVIKIEKKYGQKVFNFFRNRLSDPEIALDLAQDTFLKILGAHADFKPRKEHAREKFLSGWIFTIARNTLRNYYRDSSRRKKREPFSIDDEGNYNADLVASTTTSPEKIIIDREADLKEILRTQLDKMDDIRKLVIYLKHYFGLTNAEIGEVLGKTEGAIKSLYYRSIKELTKAYTLQLHANDDTPTNSP